MSGGFPALLSCVAKQDVSSEIGEITHAKANTFQDLCFVVASLDETVGPGDIHGVQNLVEPVAICFGAIGKFGQDPLPQRFPAKQ